MPADQPSRRGLLKTMGTAAALAAIPSALLAASPRRRATPDDAPVVTADEPSEAPARSRVAITAGQDRATNTLDALKPFAAEVAQAIGTKRVIVKPNMVAIENPRACTHVDCVRAILDFLQSIHKLDNVVIAESSAEGCTTDGFDMLGYRKLAEQYRVKLQDLNEDDAQIIPVADERDLRGKRVRFSCTMLDPNSYIISAARIKTHNLVGATLSLKNVVMGSPLRNVRGAGLGKRGAGGWSDKPIMHGNGFKGINFNLYLLAQRLHPHLSVNDGFEGMEGEGPADGPLIRHGVCVASTDWLAADRVAVDLMGINFARIPYLNHCADAAMGQADLQQIDLIAEPIQPHIKRYRMHPNFLKATAWF